MKIETFELPSLEEEGYQILKVIGKGGAGTVYSAFDLEEKRQVAIKIIKENELDSFKSQPSSESISSLNTQTNSASSSLSHSRNTQSLFKELATSTRIQHPNIVQITDFGVSEQKDLYLVMDLLHGLDCAQLIKNQGPLKASKLLPLFCDALDAIAEAHDQKIVHQDLKPSNLFLCLDPSSNSTEFNKMMVMDFGIAQRIQPGQIQDVVKGSMPYIAPEYLKERIVSTTGDLYQLGLTLIELLTGKRVVGRMADVQMMYKHLTGKLDIDDRLMKGNLGKMIQKAIVLNPKDRYQHARDFKEDLLTLTPTDIKDLESLLTPQLLTSSPSTHPDPQYASLPNKPIPTPHPYSSPITHAVPQDSNLDSKTEMIDPDFHSHVEWIDESHQTATNLLTPILPAPETFKTPPSEEYTAHPSNGSIPFPSPSFPDRSKNHMIDHSPANSFLENQILHLQVQNQALQNEIRELKARQLRLFLLALSLQLGVLLFFLF